MVTFFHLRLNVGEKIQFELLFSSYSPFASLCGWPIFGRQRVKTAMWCCQPAIFFVLVAISRHGPGTPRPTIYKWLFQLDDEPNLYIGNGCFTKHPFLNVCLGFQGVFKLFQEIGGFLETISK